MRAPSNNTCCQITLAKESLLVKLGTYAFWACYLEKGLLRDTIIWETELKLNSVHFSYKKNQTLGSVDNFGPVDSEKKQRDRVSKVTLHRRWVGSMISREEVIEISQHSIPSPGHHTTNRLSEAMKLRWWGPGSKWETLIIEVGGVFWVVEAPRHSCVSLAVGVCANASVCMFSVNFCQPTTGLTEICCIINSNILVVF